MEFLSNYGLFLAKSVTIVIAIAVVVGILVSASMRGRRSSERGHIEITKLNDIYMDMADTLKSAILDAEQYKKVLKQEQKEEKAKKKLEAKKKESLSNHQRKRVYVVDFDGDIKASATESLREEITAILAVADAHDEVVVRLESGGGMVHSYGLASSQLSRIVDKGIALTACVDKVAASGGYMMACVANKIVAAPFAVIGSIGVVAQLPNFHKVLQKHDVDYEVLTAGEYKRTLTVFGENTEKGRKKFLEDLEDTHVLFKDFVGEKRRQVNLAEVATGEVWFGQRALEHKLVDELQTSDDYLTGLADTADLFEVSYVHKKTLQEKLGISVAAAVDKVLLTWWSRVTGQRFH